MSPLQRRAAAATVALGAALALTACGIDTGGDAPVGPVIHQPATVIDMPDGAGNIARVCIGQEGIYSGENAGAPFVVATDPACGG